MLRRLSSGRQPPPVSGPGEGRGNEDDEVISCSTVCETVRGAAAEPHPAENGMTLQAGWLNKQSTKKKAFTGKPIYNRRYFILQAFGKDSSGAMLSWYESNKAAKPSDSVEVTRQCSARALPAMDKPHHRKFHFELAIPDKRVYVLRTMSADSRAAWVSALSRAIAPPKVTEGTSTQGGAMVRVPEGEDAEGRVEGADSTGELWTTARPGDDDSGTVGTRVGDDDLLSLGSVAATGPHPLEDRLTLKGGWLFKQTAKKSGYRRRYFIAQSAATGPSRLGWYEGTSAMLCKDFIALTPDVTVQRLADLDRPDRKSYFLEIVAPSKSRTYVLRAMSEGERDAWVGVLGQAVKPVVMVDGGTAVTPPDSPVAKAKAEEGGEEVVNAADVRQGGGLAVASATFQADKEEEEEEGEEELQDIEEEDDEDYTDEDQEEKEEEEEEEEDFEDEDEEEEVQAVAPLPSVAPAMATVAAPLPVPASVVEKEEEGGEGPTLGRFTTPRQHASPLRLRRQNLGHTDPQAPSPPRRASTSTDNPRLPGPTDLSSLAGPPPAQAPSPDRHMGLPRVSAPSPALPPNGSPQRSLPSVNARSPPPHDPTAHKKHAPSTSLLSTTAGVTMSPSQWTSPERRTDARTRNLGAGDDASPPRSLDRGYEPSRSVDRGYEPSSPTRTLGTYDTSPSRSPLRQSGGGYESPLREDGLARQMEILMTMNLKLTNEADEERRRHATTLERLREEAQEERRKHMEETRILALHIQELSEGIKEGRGAGPVDERVRQLEREVDAMRGAREEAARFVEEARELQAASSQREREALQAQDTAQRRARALEEEVSLLRTLGEELREKVQEGHAEEARLREKGIEKDEAVAGVKRQLREAERALAEALAEAQALRKQAEEEAGAAGADRDGKLLEVWTQNKELRAQVEAMESEKRDRERGLEAMREQLQSLMEQHEEVSSQADHMSGEMVRLQKERDEARIALGTASAEAEAARAWQEAQVEEHVASALHNAAQQQQALVADKERLASDLELLRSELEHAHTRVQAQDKRLQAMAATERRVLELEALLDTAQQQGRGREEDATPQRLLELQAEKQQLEDAHEATKASLEEAQARIKEQETEKGWLMSEVEALQLTLRQLKDRHDEEESRLIAMGEDMERRIIALNEALERHRVEGVPLEAVGTQLKEAQEAKARLQETVMDLQQAKEALEGRLREWERTAGDEVVGLHQRLREMQEAQSLQAAKTQAELDVMAVHASLDDATHEIDLADKRCEALKRACSELRVEHDRLQSELSDTRARLRTASDEAEEARRDRDTALRSAEEAHHERLEAEGAIETLKGELQHTMAQLRRAEAQLQRNVELVTQQEQGHDGDGDGELARLRDEVRALETARLLDIQELEDCKRELQSKREGQVEQAALLASTLEQLEAAKTTAREAEEKVQQADAQRDQALADLQTAQEALSSVRSVDEVSAHELVEATQRCNALEERLADSLRAGAETEERLGAAQEALSQATSEVSELQYTVQGLEECKAELEGRLRSEEARSAALESFNTEAAGSVRELEDALAQAKARLEALEKAAGDAGKTAAEAEKAAAEAREQLEQATAELRQRGSEAADRTGMVKRLEARIAELLAEVKVRAEAEESLQRRLQGLVGVVKRDEEERARWEADLLQVHARELQEKEGVIDTWRARAAQAQERAREAEEELGRAKEGLERWEGRLQDEVGRLRGELEGERARGREVHETLGRQARRTMQAERDRDVAIKSTRQRDRDLATTEELEREEERIAEARLLLEAERQKVEAMRLALLREKRTIDEQMLTLSREAQRRKDLLGAQTTPTHERPPRAQQENFRPYSAPPMPENRLDGKAGSGRAMVERNAVTQELRRQAGESKALKGTVLGLKEELRDAHRQVAELARVRGSTPTTPSADPRGKGRTPRTSRDEGSSRRPSSSSSGSGSGSTPIYTKDEVMRMQRELEHRRQWLAREEATRRGTGGAGPGGAWI